MTVVEFKTKWRKPVVKNRPNDGDDVFVLFKNRKSIFKSVYHRSNGWEIKIGSMTIFEKTKNVDVWCYEVGEQYERN
jgi:hypothetical protein